MSPTDWAPLQSRLGDKVRLGEPLARHTSFRIGGPAEAWVGASNEVELLACLDFAEASRTPLTLLAAGTNILVRDGGIKGLVLSLDGDFEAFSQEGAKARAGAAMNLALLARKTALAGWKGLEWAVGIPGSLGGALVMNAGAHGGEIARAVRRVGLVLDGRPQVWTKEDCGFAYRHSRFKELPAGSLVLTWAELELEAAPAGELKARMDEAMAKRRASQPPLGSLPNAGCVFKNPEGDSAGRMGDSAGRMIEACGLKGRRQGGAEISPVHANFVVNTGSATAADVLALMDQARAAVKERFGVELSEEILVLGEEA